MVGIINNNVIAVRQGDSFNITVQLKKECKAMDLRGATLLMQAKDNADNIVINCTGESIDAANGKMILRLTPVMTDIAVGDYRVDIQVTMPDGSVNTIFPANVHQVGVFRITEQVTQI